jgi:hypothetical protein
MIHDIHSPITYKGQRLRYTDGKGQGKIGTHAFEADTTIARLVLRLLGPRRPEPYYDIINKIDSKTLGLADRGYEDTNITATEAIESLGVRTVPVLARAIPAEIIHDNNRLSIEDAKNMGIIHPDDDPIQIFRGYITPYRVRDVDIFDEENGEMDNHYYNNVTKMVAQGLCDMQIDNSIPVGVRESFIRDKNFLQLVRMNRQNNNAIDFRSDASLVENYFDIKQYLRWFSKQTMKDLAKIHISGNVHRYPTTHNYCLDGRIMDNDGWGPGTRREFAGDFDTAFYGFDSFYRSMIELFDLRIDAEYLWDSSLQAYNQTWDRLSDADFSLKRL